jgi:hypothetical protein
LLQGLSLVRTQMNGWCDPHPLGLLPINGCGIIKVVTYDALH